MTRDSYYICNQDIHQGVMSKSITGEVFASVSEALLRMTNVLDWGWEIRRTRDDSLMAKGTFYDWADREPSTVLKQLVANGTVTLRQIKRATAELDPDHTVLDSIVMAADEAE